MSTHRAPAQRLTNTFVVGNTAAPVFQLANLTTVFAAQSAQQIGSLFVAPSGTAISNALAAATAPTVAVNYSLIDLGKTLTVQVNNATDGACYMKFREVKYQTATSTFVTGYVVVENNYQLVSGDKGKVLVARA
jgi:hypothetical protein